AQCVFDQTAFDQIYHEHASTWSLRSISELAQRAGLRVISAIVDPIHGGSLRCVLSRNLPVTESTQLLLDEERKQHNPPQLDFAERVQKTRKQFRDIWGELQNETVVAYGASAKANTALAWFGVAPSWFVDDNQLKWNLLTPGTN